MQSLLEKLPHTSPSKNDINMPLVLQEYDCKLILLLLVKRRYPGLILQYGVNFLIALPYGGPMTRFLNLLK
ncbi:hypothetical protein ABES08_02940 [Peribacillus simplex]|uniref:hypothetical protein n=1 Tax=Peribacillus simplex TaxID=1478 RepID=UPI003CE9A82C